jgi:hypothetical protein
LRLDDHWLTALDARINERRKLTITRNYRTTALAALPQRVRKGLVFRSSAIRNLKTDEFCVAAMRQDGLS